MEPSCPLGTNRCIPQAKFLQKPYNKFFIDQVCSVKMAGYWPRSFFASLWTSTSSRFINTQKKNLADIQPSWPHTWSITHTYHCNIPCNWVYSQQNVWPPIKCYRHTQRRLCRHSRIETLPGHWVDFKLLFTFVHFVLKLSTEERPGARFSKGPEALRPRKLSGSFKKGAPGTLFLKVLKRFRTRKAIVKSRLMWWQSCFIHIS